VEYLLRQRSVVISDAVSLLLESTENVKTGWYLTFRVFSNVIQNGGSNFRIGQ